MTRLASALLPLLLTAPTAAALAHDGHAHGEGIQFWHLLLAFVILSAAWFAWVGWMKRRAMSEAEAADGDGDELSG